MLPLIGQIGNDIKTKQKGLHMKIKGFKKPKQIQHMTRAEWKNFLADINHDELGFDREKWQSLAKKLDRIIPTAWLTLHLTQIEVRQRQKLHSKRVHIPRESLEERRGA